MNILFKGESFFITLYSGLSLLRRSSMPNAYELRIRVGPEIRTLDNTKQNHYRKLAKNIH